MKSIAKKFTSVLVAAALVPAVALPPSLASADPAEDPRYEAALDEALNLVQISEDSQDERWFVNEEGYVQLINRGIASGVQTLSDLPESYTAPYTEVKFQGSTQSCWTFAAIGSLESAALKQQQVSDPVRSEPNYAEAQVVYGTFNGRTGDGTLDGEEIIASDNDSYMTFDNAYGYLTPGNWFFATSTLAAGKGISDEGTFSSAAYAPYASLDGFVNGCRKSAESIAENYDSSELRLDHAVSLHEPTPVINISEDGRKVERPWNDETSMAAVQELKQAIHDEGAFNFLYYTAEASSPYYHASPREEDPQYASEDYVLLPNYWIYDADDVNGEGTVSQQVNHVVLAVGWDDTYSRWNFATPLLNDDGSEKAYDKDIATVEEYKGTNYIVPKGDGAWIMKNSYGTSATNAEGKSLNMGDDGIFYLSYYEKTISSPSVMAPEDTTDGEKEYEIVHQYDVAVGDVFSYGEAGQSLSSGANVFSVDQAEILEAVGLWTMYDNTDVNIKVYTNLEDPNNPESGTLAHEQTLQLGRFGWYTVALDEAVAIDADSTYSVEITLTDNDIPYQIIEKPYVYPAQLYVGEGESFLKMKAGDEDVWVDVADIAASLEGETGDGEAAGNPAGEAVNAPTVRDSSDPATIVQNEAIGNLTIKAFSNPVQEPVDPGNPDDPSDEPVVPSEDDPSGNNQQSDTAGSSDNKEGLPHTGDPQVAIPLTLSVLVGSAAVSLIARRKSKIR